LFFIDIAITKQVVDDIFYAPRLA